MDTNVLFKEIKDNDETVASALEEADLITDTDLQLLTREDLRDLLPGPEHFKRRKLAYDIVHNQKPINVVMKENLKDFIPDEHPGAVLTSNGVLVDCLNDLKDLKTQMTKVQNILETHTNLLKELSKSQPTQDQDKGSSSSSSHGSGSMKRRNSQTSNSPQIAGSRGSSTSSLSSTVTLRGHSQKTQAIVNFKMVVSGKTFDAHRQLLDKVQASSGEPDLILINQEEYQSNQDHKVVIVFCPVVSRIGTDADAALNNVTDGKPVILVFMHHTHSAKSVTAPRTWDNNNVVLCVHVFYHETVHGLLQCQENNTAITEIRQELISLGDKTSAKTSGNAENETKKWLFNFFQSK